MRMVDNFAPCLLQCSSLSTSFNIVVGHPSLFKYPPQRVTSRRNHQQLFVGPDLKRRSVGGIAGRDEQQPARTKICERRCLLGNPTTTRHVDDLNSAVGAR